MTNKETNNIFTYKDVDYIKATAHEEVVNRAIEDTRKQYADELIEWANKNKVGCWHETDECDCDGYNEALGELIEHLQNNKK